jgi:hypothetical protein
MGDFMAVQIVPLIKALYPIAAAIADKAIPAFTALKSEAAKQDPVLARQIKELQDASKANAEELQSLAEHLQVVISTADEAAAAVERRMASYEMLLLVSLGVSAVSLVVAIAALMG